MATAPADLIAELKGLREQRGAIEAKETMIERLLDTLAEHSSEAAEEIAALGGSVAIGPLRDQIRAVFESRRDNGERTMVPKAVREALNDRGNRNVTLDNVRVTMKRMEEGGELERPLPNAGESLFALPGTREEFSDEIEELGKKLLKARD